MVALLHRPRAPRRASCVRLPLPDGPALSLVQWLPLAPPVCCCRIAVAAHPRSRWAAHNPSPHQLTSQHISTAWQGDKRKALRSLKKARLELDLLSEELAQLQARLAGGVLRRFVLIARVDRGA